MTSFIKDNTSRRSVMERLFIPICVLYRPLRISPTRSPQGGRGMAAKRGQDQRIVCACCRRLRPRLRSVSSRLTVCARCYRCVLDKPTEVGAVAKGIRPKVTRPHARRARQHAHTNNLTETDRSAKPNQTLRRQPPRPTNFCLQNPAMS